MPTSGDIERFIEKKVDEVEKHNGYDWFITSHEAKDIALAAVLFAQSGKKEESNEVDSH